MSNPGPFELVTSQLGPLPVVNHFLGRLGVQKLLQRHVPADDRRLRLAPAVVLGVVVRNLVLHREPVYALAEWATPFDPVAVGLGPGDVDALNDDRVGRSLARLFDADRATLLTEVVVGAVQTFGIDCSQLHNDSTSVTFSGVYARATGRSRGNKATAAITWGHNKDHRPDLKQLVWILTVSADGAVPLAYRVESGNTADDATHVPTWDALVALVGRCDFLYVADCKLASRDNLDHIDARGGRFLTVLPRTRREDRLFREQAAVETPAWVEIARRSGRRVGDPDEVWWAVEAAPSEEGYRVVWVRSSTKIALDAKARADRIERAVAALTELNRRLAGPKSRLKTRVAVDKAATAAIERAGASRWVSVEITEQTRESYRQEHTGRPGPDTRYRKLTRTYFALHITVRDDVIAADAATDGCFPLITNDGALSPAELLTAYKYQPNLERRHAQLKGVQLVAPMFLRDPARIEGLLCCHFIALLVQALIEREIRTAMKAAGTTSIPLYPEDRACGSPSAARVLEIFNGLARHALMRDGQVIQIFEPTLTPLQREVLDLLGIPASVYTAS